MNDGNTLFEYLFTRLISKSDTYRGRWICDQSLVEILHRHYTNVDKDNTLRNKLVQRLNKAAGPFNSSNVHKIYHKNFTTSCPFNSSLRRMVHYYYFGKGEKVPNEPIRAAELLCTEIEHIQSYSATNNRQRSCNKPEQVSFPDDGCAGKKKNKNNENKRKEATKSSAAAPITPTPQKRTRRSQRLVEQQQSPLVPFVTNVGRLEDENNQVDDEDEDEDDDNNNSSGDIDGDNSSNNQTPNIIWQSPEAAALFGFDEGADVYNGLVQLVESLTLVGQSANGYEEAGVIDLHEDSKLTKHALFDLRNKCLYLRVAYSIALAEYRVGFPFQACCDKAARLLNDLTLFNAATGRTIMNWNRIFRVNHQFPNPNPYVANGIKRKPTLFEVFPTAAVDVSNFILDHLEHFSVELLREHFNTTMIKQLNEEVKTNINFTEDSEEFQLVDRYLKNPPSYSTVGRWVGYLGFKREVSKKCYYVDGHEYAEQIEHRSRLTDEYLSVLEPRSHRWVHLSQTEFDDLKTALEDDKDGEKAKDMLDKVAYKFKGVDEKVYFEFHVDKHVRLQKIANDKYGAFGGRVSIRKKAEDKPVIIFGQDEAIFNAFLSRTHQWVDPNGRRAIMPKTVGAGIMISAFQSRELGWGIPITEDQLKEINAARANQEYFDKAAAIAVNGNTKKQPLESSPGILKFAYGKNGYWTGNHTILQTEDIIDCVKVILGDEYEYVFLFDSSSGHAKKRVDGLDAKEMNKNWHSTPSQARNTKIERQEEFVGPYYDASNPAMVTIGQEQTMNFTSEDVGPFWLTAEERERQRHDREVEIPEDKRKERHKVKKELISELMDTEWGKKEGEIRLWKMTHAELAKMAQASSIDIKITPTTKMIYGWEGKGKGLLQIAYERGWIDIATFRKGSYQVMKYDDEGNLVPELSLRHLLANCTDFLSEQSQLEYVCESLGVRALITTKYHAEYAGEGVEYSWGFSKALYRRHPLAQKKTTADFLALVDKCISREVLTVDLIRKFSARARGYMETYKMLEIEAKNTKETEGNSSEDAPIPHKRIETLKKVLKCHRAAIDFDKSFIMKTVYAKDFDFKNDLLKKEEKLNFSLRVKRENTKVEATAKKK